MVLLGTGMRVSEFCGLTVKDLDFANRRIRVDHQLIRERGGKYYVEKTKTECGRRFIPMTDEVCQSLQNILANRKQLKQEVMIDGRSGFLLLDKKDMPKVALHIENEVRWVLKKYSKQDWIVRYCLEHKIYNINQVNALLFEYGQDQLGS